MQLKNVVKSLNNRKVDNEKVEWASHQIAFNSCVIKYKYIIPELIAMMFLYILENI
jgi:hypothetical protein